MTMTDPIADMLTRLRNANSVLHDKVEIPGSKIKKAIASVLKEEGFIKDFTFTENNKQGVLTLTLKYGPKREKVISGIKRISKPGLRMCKTRGASEGAGGPWNRHYLHVEGHHERQASAQCRSRRRGHRIRLVNQKGTGRCTDVSNW